MKAVSALRALRKAQKSLASTEERIKELQAELDSAYEDKQTFSDTTHTLTKLLAETRAKEDPEGFYLFVKGMCTNSCRRMPYSKEVKSLDRALKQGVPEDCYEARLVVVFNKKGKRDKIIAKQNINQWDITAAGKKTIKELSL